MAAPRVAAVVVGLALGGCIVPQPAYGIPDPSSTGTEGTMGTSTDTGETEAMTSTGTSTAGTSTAGTSTGMADSETGDTDATAGSTSVGEPDYGVPESTG